MANFSSKLFLLSLLFLLPIRGLSQDYLISTKSENIIVKNDTSFINNVSVSLKRSDKYIVYPIFYDEELEDVSDIALYIKKGNRFKAEKDISVSENNIDIDYITSKKIKSVLVPPEVEAKITYTVKCNELMYFSDLPLFSYSDIDTLKYQITVPETFRFLHNIIYADSLDYLEIDSLKSDSVSKWNIEVVPLKVESDPMILFGIYRNLKIPLMRTIVVPSEYKDRAKEYLNDWYIHKIENRRGLDSVTICKIDELTHGITDTLQIVDILYDYVKSNFKYVAIEIGLGAFVPTHVNEVFLNKQGDCKDLSNFLSEALNYKGIKSNVALAATHDHVSDCDFPSLSSANHVICVAYINNEPVILDPTDPIHIPGEPVQSIQERSILIIDQNGGKYYKINVLPPKQNVINYSIELKANSEKLSMEGKFNADYNGISGNFLRYEFIDITNDELNAFGKKHYESVFGNQTVSDFSVDNQGKSIEVTGKLFVNGKMISDNNYRFLFIDFLPRIIETEDRETLLEGTYLGNTFDKKVKLRIILDKPFEPFDPIEHAFSNEGVSLDLKITNPSDSIIECDYEFILDHIFIDKENLDIINDILKSFKEISNEPVILKNID